MVQVIHLFLPSITITDPNATTLGTGTASIGDGVISRWTYARRFRLQTRKHNSNVAVMVMQIFCQLVQRSKLLVYLLQKPGSSIVFSNASQCKLYCSYRSFTRKRWYNKFRSVTKYFKGKCSTHGTTATIRQNYSNIRLTGHDFLDIGTGGIATTNYPDLNGYTQAPDQADEVEDLDRGRVFYTSTDQDGNFRVGELFRVEQSTGKATLNAEAFDLSGLRQLSLGSVALGNFGATVNEFSTDGTLGDNSDNALVTEKAIRTFVENQLGGGQNNLTVNSAVIGEITISGANISASTGNTKLYNNTTNKY